MRRTRFSYGLIVGQLMSVLVCGVLVGNGVAQDDSSGGASERLSERLGNLVSYHIEHVEAKHVYQLLAEMVADSSVRLGLDEKGNNVYAIAPPEMQDQLFGLIKRVDQPTEQVSVQVYNVQHIPADTAASMLQSMITGEDVRFALDSAANRVIVSGSDAMHDAVAELLAKLDRPSSDSKKSATPAEATAVRVRAIWLMASPLTESKNNYDRMTKPTDELADVVAELRTMGIDHLVHVGQTIINTTTDSTFEVSSQLDVEPLGRGVPADWSIEGSLTPSHDDRSPSRLKIQLIASDVGTENLEPAKVANIQTELIAPYGHYLVLGATPWHHATSVFVVQVTRVD